MHSTHFGKLASASVSIPRTQNVRYKEPAGPFVWRLLAVVCSDLVMSQNYPTAVWCLPQAELAFSWLMHLRCKFTVTAGASDSSLTTTAVN